MDEIEKAVAAIRAQGGTDADVEAYLREQGFEPSGKKEPKSKLPDWVRNLASLDRKMIESAADMLTAGASGFIGDAAASLVPGQPSFTELRDARRERMKSMPWYATLASAAPAMAYNPGAALGAIPRTAGTIRTLLQGAAEGAVQGGAMVAGTGAGTTGNIPLLGGDWEDIVGGTVVGSLFGSAGAGAGRRLARRGEMGEAKQNAARMYTNAVETEGMRAVPTGANMPPMVAADQLGEIGQGIVKAAARLPEARTELRPALESRVKQMFPSLLRSFDEATGTTTDDAVRLAADIRAAEAARDAANGAQKEQYKELVRTLKDQYRVAVEQSRASHRAAKPVERTTTEAIDALRGEGDIPDIDKTLRSMHEQRGKVGTKYEDVWEVTRGKAVPSTPAADNFLKTDVGDAAWAAVKNERLNEAITDPTRALPTKNGEAVPDAEAWHRMKEMVNQRAKVGAYEGPLKGVDAKRAVFIRDKVLPTLHEQSKAAESVDLQYANMSDEMRAFAAGTGKRWSKSYDEMSPALQEQYRAGLRARLGKMVQKGGSRDAMAEKLADPNTTLAQEFDLAFGPGASQRVSLRIATPKQPPYVKPTPPVVPPEPAPIPQSPEATGFFTGERVFDAPAVGTGNRASVSEELTSLFGLPVAGQQAGQKGLAGRYRNSLLEGRTLDLNTPAARERFGVAAVSPDKARGYAGTESAWDAARKLTDKVLSGDVVTPTERMADVFGEIAGGASINPWWWGTQVARRFATDAMVGRAAERQGKTAREVVRIAKDKSPDAISNAILTLKQLEQKKADWGTRAAVRAGRAGGLLGSSF